MTSHVTAANTTGRNFFEVTMKQTLPRLAFYHQRNVMVQEGLVLMTRFFTSFPLHKSQSSIEGYHTLAYHIDTPDDPQRLRAVNVKEIEQNLHQYVNFMSVSTETYLWEGLLIHWADERMFGRPIIIYNPDGRLCCDLQHDMDVGSNPRSM